MASINTYAERSCPNLPKGDGCPGERLKDMTLDDFLAEGVVLRPEAFNDPENAYMQGKELFIHIWDSTIKKEQHDLYGWEANPWTWVIAFERCEKPEGWCV